MYDYLIIGSGIVGAFIARELAQYQVKVLLVEKENDYVNGQTIANSAIIHAGHDPQPGTLKARLCVWGNRLYSDYAQDLKIPLLKTGALMLAHNQEEEDKLKAIYERAMINGVPAIQLLSKSEALDSEPNLDPTITMALSLPTTMVTFPWEVALHALENASDNGVELKKNAEVINIVYQDGIYHVTLRDQSILQTRSIINAAGIHSDEIAKMLEAQPEFTITPRRGEYYVLDKRVKGWIHQVIYPTPSEKGKGILAVPQVHGNILLGPTSIVQEDKGSLATTKDGLQMIKDSIKNLVINVPYGQVIRQFVGVRATSTYRDFYIQESKQFTRFYHVVGIDSPGLTSAPAIAKYLVEEVMQLQANRKENYRSSISKKIHYSELSDEEKYLLFRNNPQYGNIVCKCENITEAEIVEAIKGPLGSDTIKGIKKRVRAGSGLCQGGYCEHQVLKIIARETRQPLHEVNYYSLHSSILLEETKVKK